MVLRKAYGGAYIVMDSKDLGNDWCVAWPTAEIAVMGAPGAVQILHRRDLAAIDDDAERLAEQLALEAEYADRFANPYVAAERGYVDDVIAAVRHPAGPRRRARCASAPSASSTAEPPPLEHTALARPSSLARTGRPPCCRASASS